MVFLLRLKKILCGLSIVSSLTLPILLLVFIWSNNNGNEAIQAGLTAYGVFALVANVSYLVMMFLTKKIQAAILRKEVEKYFEDHDDTDL